VDSPEGATVNIESVKRYPLEWPIGWKRTTYRKAAPFFKQVRQYTETGSYARKESLSVGDATTRLMGELKRLGARHVIISSNLRVREDGLPYAQQAKQIPDPGVAVYFQLSGQPRVLACDKWSSVGRQPRRDCGHIEAIRACDRYGVGTLEQAFTGYKALPADFGGRLAHGVVRREGLPRHSRRRSGRLPRACQGTSSRRRRNRDRDVAPKPGAGLRAHGTGRALRT
jgi:hypothetical protein